MTTLAILSVTLTLALTNPLRSRAWAAAFVTGVLILGAGALHSLAYTIGGH